MNAFVVTTENLPPSFDSVIYRKLEWVGSGLPSSGDGGERHPMRIALTKQEPAEIRRDEKSRIMIRSSSFIEEGER